MSAGDRAGPARFHSGSQWTLCVRGFFYFVSGGDEVELALYVLRITSTRELGRQGRLRRVY